MPGSGAPVYASDINTRIGTTEATSDISAASYSSEAVLDTVTVTVVNGKRYQIRYFIPYTGTVAADGFLIRIRTGTTTAGTQLTYDTAETHSTGRVYCLVVIAEWTASATGSQSFCATANRSAGTGNLTAKGASTQIRLLTVDLINTA